MNGLAESREMNSRRDFIKYSVATLLALNFGCSIKDLIGGKEGKIALVFGTKYGATEDTASWIREGIGEDVDLINIEELVFKKAISSYDHFIVGSGVWIDGVHKRLKDFLTAEPDQLKGMVIASFVVCGSQDRTEGGRKRIQKYLDQIQVPLGYEPALTGYFGGRIIVEQLTEEDRAALEKFYRTFLKTKLESWDRTDREKAVSYGRELNPLIEKYSL